MKKRILGIFALLALVAMCVTFTACVVDTEERIVTFTNELGVPVNLTFSNINPNVITLAAVTLAKTPPDSRQTVTLVGKDIGLIDISFGSGVTEADVEVKGTLITGDDKSAAQVRGLPLKAGTITFYPRPGAVGAVIPAKIDVIQLDD